MELIAVPDAARRTGLSPEFIRQLARQGKVRAQPVRPCVGRGRPKKEKPR